MAKTHVNLTVDLDTYLLLKAQNRNISGIVNEFLKNLVVLESELPEDTFILREEIIQISRSIQESNTLLAQKSAMLSAAIEKKEREKKEQMEKWDLIDKTMKLNNPMRFAPG